MKNKVLIIVLLAQMWCLTAIGKTTYIPTYRSYIHIVNGTDTISVDGNLPELKMTESGGLFTIRIEHEEVTKEKVKAIKRAKAAAGWMSFSAVMSGVSTTFSENTLQYYIRSTNERLATDLAQMYEHDSKNEQKLDIDLWIENHTEAELVVNDMERGLTWYILPGQSANFKTNNPEAARFRISDIHNIFLRYVTGVAGSSVKKWEIAYEDDECWVAVVFEEGAFRSPETITGYRLISKIDFSERDMSTDELTAFKASKKQGNIK